MVLKSRMTKSNNILKILLIVRLLLLCSIYQVRWSLSQHWSVTQIYTQRRPCALRVTLKTSCWFTWLKAHIPDYCSNYTEEILNLPAELHSCEFSCASSILELSFPPWCIIHKWHFIEKELKLASAGYQVT